MNEEHRWFVIINPTAGGNRAAKRWPRLSAMLQEAGIAHEHAFTQRRGHAALLARNAVRAGFRKIITVGGDGTNNEVMNGVMKQKVVPSNEITCALIPVGTGNDWIKHHKIPKNAKKVIQLIKAGKTDYQDIGLATYMHNGEKGRRYFINVAGMGYDAYVAEVSEKKRNLVTNQLFYFYLVFHCLRSFTPPRTRVTFADGRVEEGLFFSLNFGLCKYSGGGMRFVPHAVHNDGKFAYLLAKDFSKWDVVKATPMFYNGKVEQHPKTLTGQSETITVEGLNGDVSLLEVDGEFLGQTPVTFSTVDKALKVIVP